MDDLAATYMAQRKHDGCNAIALVYPNAANDRIISRTGEGVKSCQHIIVALRQRLSARLAEGQAFAVLGEVWQPGVAQAAISGDFRRHSPAPNLQFVVFDILAADSFRNGVCGTPFRQRYARAFTLFRGAHPRDVVQLCNTYNPGTYGLPQQMADSLCKQGGYDGLILRDPEAGWVSGSGTDGEIIKVKPVMSLDLRVLDVEEGKGKYAGTLGALVCQGPKGKVKVSGMTDGEREEWWASREVVGKIVEVQCLGLTAAGSLREPRFKGVRYDKEKADFE
ncbi:ATP-dependent DNA ligase domain protein [Bordetella bronchiseptica MBORD707]|nr:ATP-dependent DNA ligase domain protein [Bordetella bronchiseptica MBORD707]